MKLFLYITTIFIITTGTAQITVVPIEDRLTDNHPEENVYYKDTNHLFDKYLGEWTFNDGTHVLEVEISKAENREIGGGFINTTNFWDFLIIEYRYTHNGVLKYDTFRSPVLHTGTFYSSSTLWFLYQEPPLNGCRRMKEGELFLKFISDNTVTPPGQVETGTLEWKWQYTYYDKGTYECLDDPNGQADFSDLLIPKNLILERE